jgi:hypothetical protein
MNIIHRLRQSMRFAAGGAGAIILADLGPEGRL